MNEPKSDEEIEAAIRRVCQAALKGGVDKQDTLAPLFAFTMWKHERTQREALMSDADIGRRVRNSQSEAQRRKQLEQDFRILECAIGLLKNGNKERGLATKIIRHLKLELSERQVNRTLDKFQAVYYSP